MNNQPAPKNGKTILVTEDDKLFRDLLSRKLSFNGFEAVLAVDVESALKAMETTIPDLAVFDILLPGASGYDLLAQVRKNEKTKDMPVIFLSNLSSKEDFQKGRELRVSSFLVKATVTPDEVMEEVKRVLKM